MSKIEPMSVGKMQQMIADWQSGKAIEIGGDVQMAMLLRWIHAEARARMLEYLSRHSDCDDELCFFGEEHLEFDGRGELPHFVTAVKREVGWPGDYNQC